MDINHAAGRRIRVLRNVLGLSQAALASRVGVSHHQIQKYESGKNSISLEMLTELGKALQIKPERLLKEVLEDVTANEVESADAGVQISTGLLHEIEDPGVRRAINKLIKSLSEMSCEQN